MANPQHIAWLLEGVEAWNRRRDADGSIMPDFTKADLYTEFEEAGKIDADGYIPLDGANLEYANFSLAILQKPGLDDAATGPLQGTVSLQDANLHMVNLYGAQLEKARLNRVDMTEAVVEKSHLEGHFSSRAVYVQRICRRHSSVTWTLPERTSQAQTSLTRHYGAPNSMALF